MSEFIKFQFVCSQENSVRAAEILQGIECVQSVGFNASEITQFVIGSEGVEHIQKGLGIVGIAFPDCVDTIIKALAEEGIAGFSRESQILFSGFPPQENTGDNRSI